MIPEQASETGNDLRDIAADEFLERYEDLRII